MPPSLPYTSDELADAIARSHSWRGVLRCLGKSEKSAGSFRSARRHADALGIDYSHFTGQRRWSDSALAHAIEDARSWQDVLEHLGLSASGSSTVTVKAHAARLGLSVEHLSPPRPDHPPTPRYGSVNPMHLRSAGSMIAASWFTLRGVRVGWPLEPCRYDLTAEIDGRFERIQVKTVMAVGPSAMVSVSTSRRRGSTVYAPGEIDSYFVIDGELSAYLIPYDVVAGYGQLKLSHYANFKIVDRGDLISEASSP